MVNNYLIVLEMVLAIETLGKQINTMLTLTNRICTNERLQYLINLRVQEFKILYPEIPSGTEFIIDTLEEGLLFINANQVFRDFVQQSEQVAIKLADTPSLPTPLDSTLH